MKLSRLFHQPCSYFRGVLHASVQELGHSLNPVASPVYLCINRLFTYRWCSFFSFLSLILYVQYHICGRRAKKAELASSYLEWTSDPIHKSLTDVSGLKGEAKKQFKNLLGYCGDRKYQYPDPLIRDIVAKGKPTAAFMETSG